MSIDLTLHRIRLLLSHLPPYRRPTCHITGTNGKGSVTAILSSILLASSPPLSVGRFNSPHLVSVSDSIVINNKPVGAGEYAEVRRQVEKVDRQYEVGASSFELLTSTALMIFERAALDVVVMEVGMGGRQDATNVISDESVLVSGLTAVDLDHQAFLGGSVGAIAREKAGISRKGKPFVVGRQSYGEVDDVVRSVVEGVGGDLVVSKDATVRNWDESTDGPRPASTIFEQGVVKELPFQPVTVFMPCFGQPVLGRLPLYGAHQLANLGVASSIVSELITHPSCTRLGLKDRITPATVAHGIESTSWPGRLSFHPYTASDGKQLVILADGAHNRASASILSSYISDLLSRISGRGDLYRRFNLTYILGLSHSPPKMPQDVLEPLFLPAITRPPGLDIRVNVAAVGFTPPEGMPWVAAVPPAEIRRVISDFNTNVQCWSPEHPPLSKEAELRRALQWASSTMGNEEGGLVVVAGSLYVVADFYRELSGCL